MIRKFISFILILCFTLFELGQSIQLSQTLANPPVPVDVEDDDDGGKFQDDQETLGGDDNQKEDNLPPIAAPGGGGGGNGGGGDDDDDDEDDDTPTTTENTDGPDDDTPEDGPTPSIDLSAGEFNPTSNTGVLGTDRYLNMVWLMITSYMAFSIAKVCLSKKKQSLGITCGRSHLAIGLGFAAYIGSAIVNWVNFKNDPIVKLTQERANLWGPACDSIEADGNKWDQYKSDLSDFDNIPPEGTLEEAEIFCADNPYRAQKKVLKKEFKI